MPEWINRYKSIETTVGAGYYALRKTKYGSKLVKADRSPSGTILARVRNKRVPSVGHNPRRQRILDRRANKAHLIQEK